MRARLAFAVAATLALAGAAEAAPPAWVRDLASRPEASSAAPAVVLLDEVSVTITADGRVQTTRRYAARIADRGGRDAAAIRELYLTDSGKVREIRGWILHPSGGSQDLGNRHVADLALVNNDVFNEVRVRALLAVEEVAPGDLFAAEVESEDRLLFAQLEWGLQSRWPVRLARRSVTLPQGWRVEPVFFNMAAMEPARRGATLTWELRDVAAIDDEPAMPPVSDLAPRIALSIFGSASAPAPGQFQHWSDVASWLFRLSDAPSHPTDPIIAKTRTITASAASDYDRARSIGEYAQRIQYVSIQTGVGRGGGYQPRPAAVVMERNYGDCKDKAGIMRAMLAAAGIESYLVSIYAGDRRYVRPEWPSPQQFNHAVLAIVLREVPSGVSAIVNHSVRGPLLIFDPTDADTPFGELPFHEQGSLALLIAPDGGELLKMPLAEPSRNGIERTMDAVLGPDGTLTAHIRERRTGAFASALRAQHRTLEGSTFHGYVTRRLGAVLPRAIVSDVSVREEAATQTFVLAAQASAARYATSQGRLALVAPPFHRDGRIDVPAAGARRYPIDLEPSAFTESVRLRLPDGWAVDELPPAASLETSFGRFAVTYRQEGALVIAERTLELHLRRLPPEERAALADFFGKVRTADTTPIVLVEKQPR